jgi:hypothetical protein
MLGGASYRSGSSADVNKHFCRHSFKASLHLNFRSSPDSSFVYSCTSLGNRFAEATALACSGLCFPICPNVHAVTARTFSSLDSCKMVPRIRMALQPNTDIASWSEWPRINYKKIAPQDQNAQKVLAMCNKIKTI